MDREAQFRSAVDENKDRIYRICCCYVRDPEERKDVYQEVLIHVWENLRKFEGRSRISTWIYRITVNTCLGFARLEKRRKRLFDDEAQPDPDRTPGPPAGAAPEDGGEAIGRLYACINRLPPLDRALVSLYLEDVSTREMAEVLGIGEVNARVKLHRIKKTLKEMVENDGHES